MTEKVIVESERQVERLAREGTVAETRSTLARRLIEQLAPDLELASPELARLALDVALARDASRDPLLARLARAGGSAWLRTVDALDTALGALRKAAVTADALADAATAGGVAGARARTLEAAMRGLDDGLERAGLVDGRAAGSRLARVLATVSPDAIAAAVGGVRVVARGIVTWDAADIAWWRGLDLALSRRGGGAKVELPSFDRVLEPDRERDPLEIIADDLARGLDDAPAFAAIDAPLGDLRFEGALPREATTQLEVRRAADAIAQARAVADAVTDAILAGAPIDRIAVALPRLDEETMAPLRRVFDDAGLVAHDPRGPAPAGAGLVACAMDALAIAARGLPRRDVAVLLRSRYLDVQTLTGIAERRDATSKLLDLARALEETPTARDADGRGPVAAMVATARAYRPRADREEEPSVVMSRADLASRIGQILARGGAARTASEHATSARTLFAALGLGPRIGHGARVALAKDAPPLGVARAELRALARDAHAWDVLTRAIDAYEAAARRLGLADAPASDEAFRHHLARVLEVGAPPLGAARAGTLRVARLAELAHEELALLVVVDANDGVLPSSPAPDPLVPDALSTLLRKQAPAAAPAGHSLRRARELAALGLAVAGASRVVVTCRARDEQGGLLAAAPLVAWLEKGNVPSVPFRASRIRDRALSPSDARLAWLASAPEHAAVLAPDAARRAAIEGRRESFFYDPSRAGDEVVGALTSTSEIAHALAAETGASHPLAVTSLERVADCAFKGFAEVVLGARDREPRGELPDVREEGTLVHAALAAAFRATADLWTARPRDAAAIEARALAAADALFAGELVGSSLRDIMVARARDSVRAVLAWSLTDDAWDFFAAEQPFGEAGPGAWPPFAIEAAGAIVKLRGKIDRVDAAHAAARARAIDYKGNKRKAADVARTLGSTSFQVPLYALVAARATERPGAAGLYLPTGARDLSPDYAPKDAFTKKWADLMMRAGGDGTPTLVEQAALAVITKLRAGGLLPIPAEPAICRTCRARGGCRQPRFAVAPEEDEGEEGLV